MKKIPFLTASFLISFLSLWADEDDWRLNNSFTLSADIAYYRRAQTHKHQLIIDHSLGKADTCGICHFDGCDARHLAKKFKYEPGFRAGFTYMQGANVWEATYLWVQDWQSSCSSDNPGELFFSSQDVDYFLHDFADADRASASLASWMQNGEVNYYKYVTTHRGNTFGAAWLAGLRFIYLTEELTVNFTRDLSTSTYHVHVWNNIPALQVGGTIAWNPTKQLSWDLVAKIGIGFDACRQHTRLGDNNNTTVVRNYEEGGFATPFLADGMLSLSYQPWRFLNIHIAYQFIYLNGIALAPDQLVKEDSSVHVLEKIGAPLIHGWTAGLAFSF